MRFLLATIGYAAVATVISAVLGLGYLWQTERLTDERMFHIVAILHGIDPNAVDDDEQLKSRETPEEEPSLVELERIRKIALRSEQARLAALERGQKEFQHSLSQLVRERDRFDEMAREIEKRLQQESEDAMDEGIEAIVRDLELAKPDLGKELLMKMLDRGVTREEEKEAMSDVIRVIDSMSTETWEAILKKFQTPAEIEKLHEIELMQLSGGPKQRVLDKALGMLGNGR